jgi:leucyl-tRNA synthetase
MNSTNNSDTAARDYDHGTIESKWRSVWEQKGLYNADLHGAARPFYNLMMFPYPSAEGLHAGNCFAFTGADIYGRYMKMRGYDVFEPMGFDAFGIHSENFALKTDQHPKVLTFKNIENFRENQLKRLGAMFDWSHSLSTADPEYYRWTQWIFIQLLTHGLAEKRKAPVNWCPGCRTVLADSQVIEGRCERCEDLVVQRELSQWFFLITRYAERLLNNLDDLDWSDIIKQAQRRKIGKSNGAEVHFDLEGRNDSIVVFTTRPDTLFGATYMVLSPEHPLTMELATADRKSDVEKYVERAKRKTRFERAELMKEKTGVFSGSHAVNPVNGEKIPLWIADYVLPDYGTGAIMAVPAHDQRDFEFATEFGLPIVQVISPDGSRWKDLPREAYDGDGTMVNSDAFDGNSVAECQRGIVEWLEGKGKARVAVNYKLRDWCISRQRYWGPPIPVVYCDTCGTVPVPEEQLPVLLPDSDDYIPDGSGKSPLARNTDFMNTTCPRCGGPGTRETDVSDNFLDSGWYHLRYPSVGYDDAPFEPELTEKWLPVDMYIGGKEHAEGHLLYFRFLTMVLHDLGFVPREEPARRFRAHGLLIMGGAKMSKSKGNVVNPDTYIDDYGADTFRLYLMFLGPFDQGGEFRDEGIIGCQRFLNRVFSHFARGENNRCSDELERLMHQTIRKVTGDIENLSYNTAIAQLMTFMNAARAEDSRRRDVLHAFVKLLAPFAPFVSEELWQMVHDGKTVESLFTQRWPEYEESLCLEERVDFAVQVNGKLRGLVTLAPDATEEEVYRAALETSAVARHIEGREIRKVIFIPGKVLNIVTGK